jgi:four helix bundle protein
MTESPNAEERREPRAGTRKEFDLEDRTFEFARRVRAFLRRIPRTKANLKDGDQLIGSSGSVGANYIEANNALSRKDFVMRIKICRKEAKESHYWLRLLNAGTDASVDTERKALLQEAMELVKIFNRIVVSCGS